MPDKPSDIPFKVGKMLMDKGWSTLDALAVTRALRYAAYINDPKVKAAVGADTMFRWQLWKEVLE